MDESRLKNTDKRPKRRKDKYNPYKLYSIGAKTEAPRFFVAFTDSQKLRQCVEIDKKLFEEFDKFEREDLSFLNEVDNHYEHSELTEAALNQRASQPQETTVETVLRTLDSEKLREVLKEIPEIQRRRLLLYHFEGLTYQQIADMEGCKYQAVRQSVVAALKNLKNLLG